MHSVALTTTNGTARGMKLARLAVELFNVVTTDNLPI